jgi:hypothetical protein
MELPVNTRKKLDELLVRLRNVAGDNLEALALYGSAAGDDFDPEFSDLNVLCLVRRLDATALRALGPVWRWWRDQKQPDALLFTHDELRTSADVFAIELHDIKERHQTLFGPDPFQSLVVPMNLHRSQVERELRQNAVKLRQSYLHAAGEQHAVVRLLGTSVSTFITLFRHALIAFGDQTPRDRRETVRRAGKAFGFDPATLETILAIREKHIAAGDVESLFANYLAIIEKVTNEVDRRMA